MSSKPIIAVIGASSPNKSQEKLAYEVGRLIAKEGWTLLNGGLTGVMEASAKGASETGGVVVGILPGPTTQEANPYVTIPIATNMGHARNVIIAHTADCLIAIGKGEGTLSEIAIGLKLGKRVVGLETWEVEGVLKTSSPDEAIAFLKQIHTQTKHPQSQRKT